MSYRLYISSMPKKEYNKIKSLNLEQLESFYKNDSDNEIGEEWYKSIRSYGETQYELGSNIELVAPPKSHSTFFKKKETRETYSDYNLIVVDKTFLEYVIKKIENEVRSNYIKMATPFMNLRESDFKNEFLDSVKVEYNYPQNIYNFDFSKINQEQQNQLFEIIKHVKSMQLEWTEHYSAINLGSKQIITNSWKYEYSLFELARIYNFFDWDKNIMFFYGA